VSEAPRGKLVSLAARNLPHEIGLVTGATGFIGQHVCRSLLHRGWRVRASVRYAGHSAKLDPRIEVVEWKLEAPTVPPELLRDVSVLIHLAGRAHQMRRGADEASLYQALNVDATARLVMAARRAGVRRFVYVSSVKVLGEGDGSPYGSDAVPNPQDEYAQSKADAEEVIRCESGSMSWTIVRPAFVYGAGGKGNFVRLMRLARLAGRVPLPLGGLRNRRSVIYVENLADLLIWCAESDPPAGRVLPGVDAQAVSTTDLIRAAANAQGIAPRLFSFPDTFLALLARVTGRANEWRRLAGSFEVDASAVREIGWRPHIPFEESFRRSAATEASTGRMSR
jgi:nucleoside-diphosphate-sugar epimerase